MRHLNSTAWILLVLSSVTLAEELSPHEKLSSILSGIKSLYARYDQQASTPEIQAGEIWLKKPNRFRVNAGPPLSQTVVSDGESLWTYDRDLEQVIISDMDASASQIPVLLFAGDPADIGALYFVEFFEDERSQHFLLRPRSDNGLLTALALTFENSQPTTIVVENAMQERTTVRLFDLTTLEAGEEQFTFTVPENVDVIDDRGVDGVSF